MNTLNPLYWPERYQFSGLVSWKVYGDTVDGPVCLAEFHEEYGTNPHARDDAFAYAKLLSEREEGNA